MKLEEPVELERLARLHELLETKDDRQIRNQGGSDRLVGRNWCLTPYVVGDVVGQWEWDIPFDEIGQQHCRKEREEAEGWVGGMKVEEGGCYKRNGGKRAEGGGLITDSSQLKEEGKWLTHHHENAASNGQNRLASRPVFSRRNL